MIPTLFVIMLVGVGSQSAPVLASQIGTGYNAQSFETLADANYSTKIALVAANSRKFDNAVNVQGKPLYSYDYDIKGSRTLYPKLLGGTFSYGSVTTISWNAGVYVNTERLTKGQLTGLADAVMRATPRIVGAFGG